MMSNTRPLHNQDAHNQTTLLQKIIKKPDKSATIQSCRTDTMPMSNEVVDRSGDYAITHVEAKSPWPPAPTDYTPP